MNDKVKKLLENSKGKSVGIFIDNANWFYPQKELGWRVSFSKLLILLEKYFKIMLGLHYQRKIEHLLIISAEQSKNLDVLWLLNL